MRSVTFNRATYSAPHRHFIIYEIYETLQKFEYKRGLPWFLMKHKNICTYYVQCCI